jgi:hypothetical protein
METRECTVSRNSPSHLVPMVFTWDGYFKERSVALEFAVPKLQPHLHFDTRDTHYGA